MPQGPKLNKTQQKKYNDWRNRLPKPLQYEGDYDLKGLWMSNPNVEPSPNMHFPDTYKLPNHKTFSNESIYFNDKTKNNAGYWEETDSSFNYIPYNPLVKDTVIERKMPNGGIVLPEVEVRAKRPKWKKYENNFESQFPKSQRVGQYLDPMARALGNSETLYPDRIDKEYDKDRNDYIARALILDRNSDKYTDKEKQIINSSIYKGRSKEDVYNNPQHLPIGGSNTAENILYDNSYLENVPGIRQVIQKLAKNSINNIDIAQGYRDNDRSDNHPPEESYEEDHKGGSTDYDKATFNPLAQFLGQDQGVSKSPYTPKDDYLNFLPSYSLKDKMGITDNFKYTYAQQFIKDNGIEELKKKPYFLDGHTPSPYKSQPDLGNYKSGAAWDNERNLPYYFVSDAWDFDPQDYANKYSGNVNNSGPAISDPQVSYKQAYLMNKAGNPYKIYDRFYFDPKTGDYIDDSKDSRFQNNNKKKENGAKMPDGGPVKRYKAKDLPEVEVNAKLPKWAKYNKDFENLLPKSTVLNQYLDPMARSLGNSEVNYPERIDKEYENNRNNYIARSLIIDRAGDKYTNKEKEIINNSDFKGKDKKYAYDNPVKLPIGSDNSAQNFLYDNQYLLKTPGIRQILQSVAQHVNGTRTGTDFKEFMNDNQNLSDAPFKPKNDYFNFLPSYTVKDKSGVNPNVNSFLSKYANKNIVDSIKKNPIYLGQNYHEDIKAKESGKMPAWLPTSQYSDEALDGLYKDPLNLGKFKHGISWDRKKELPYYFISDAWDFDPSTYSNEDGWGKDTKSVQDMYMKSSLLNKVGNPYKIYDRFYFDEKTGQYIDDSKDPRFKNNNMKKKYGGKMPDGGIMPFNMNMMGGPVGDTTLGKSPVSQVKNAGVGNMANMSDTALQEQARIQYIMGLSQKYGVPTNKIYSKSAKRRIDKFSDVDNKYNEYELQDTANGNWMTFRQNFDDKRVGYPVGSYNPATSRKEYGGRMPPMYDNGGIIPTSDSFAGSPFPRDYQYQTYPSYSQYDSQPVGTEYLVARSGAKVKGKRWKAVNGSKFGDISPVNSKRLPFNSPSTALNNPFPTEVDAEGPDMDEPSTGSKILKAIGDNMPNIHFNTAAGTMALGAFSNAFTANQDAAVESANQTRRNISQQESYNPYRYGTGSTALFNNGGRVSFDNGGMSSMNQDPIQAALQTLRDAGYDIQMD